MLTSAELAAKYGKNHTNIVYARAVGNVLRPDGSIGYKKVQGKFGVEYRYYQDTYIRYKEADRCSNARKAALSSRKLKTGYEWQVQESNGSWGPWRGGFATKDDATAWMCRYGNTFCDKTLKFRLVPAIKDTRSHVRIS